MFSVRYENARYSFWQYAKRSAYHSNVDTVLSTTDIDIHTSRAKALYVQFDAIFCKARTTLKLVINALSYLRVIINYSVQIFTNFDKKYIHKN